MISIQIPTALRKFTDNQGSVDVDGATVGEALKNLAEKFPDVGKNILDENGTPRNFVNIYLGEDDVRSLNGVDTEVSDGQELLLVPSIAGGVN